MKLEVVLVVIGYDQAAWGSEKYLMMQDGDGKYHFPRVEVGEQERVCDVAAALLKNVTGLVGRVNSAESDAAVAWAISLDQLPLADKVERHVYGARVVGVPYLGIVPAAVTTNGPWQWVAPATAFQANFAFDHRDILSSAVKKL